MKIEVYSDIHCPFCYLGKRRLEQNLAAMPGGDKVEVLYRGYVLDKNAVKNSGKDVYQSQADRKGVPVENIKTAYGNIAKQGADFGLVYNMDAIIPTNTIDALALVQFAQTKGLQSKMIETLYEAYYTNGENLGELEVLVRLGAELGLDGAEIKEALASGTYQDIVLKDDAFARDKKIDGIPYFVVNGEQEFFGSDQTDKIVDYLLNGTKPQLKEIKPPSGMVCEDGVCRLG